MFKPALALLLVAAVSFARAQTPLPLTNPSFEALNPFSGSGEPLGWHNLSNPQHAKRRTATDGLVPPVTPRSGDACIEVDTNGTGGFRGFTTDTINFFDPNLAYYDPVFDWNSGDIVVTGYYMIPADAPIVGDCAAIKMNVKLGFQDYATFDGFVVGPCIQGHTDGQWVLYTARWTIANIQEQVNFNDCCNCGGTGVPGSGCFRDGIPPYPNRCKITIGRFGFGNPQSSGVIFWDDMTFGQVSACPADFNGDGSLDFFDYDDFVACFEGTACPPGADADFNDDGSVDFFDYDDFVAAFETGGC